MDIEELLKPISGDNPSGENQEYSTDFTNLEISAQLGEEKQVGDEIIAAEEPNYKEVSKGALEVLKVSHDLRAGVFLARAELSLRGLSGFAEVTTYLRRCVEDYWDSCHPQLDADDDNDPTERVNALLALAGSNTVLQSLRLTPLSESNVFGKINLQNILVARGEMTAPSSMVNVLDSSGIGAAFKDTETTKLLEFLDAAKLIAENVDAINLKFTEETPGQGPSLENLSLILKKIISSLSGATGSNSDDIDSPDNNTGEVTGNVVEEAGKIPEVVSSVKVPGVISSDLDVRMALDQIISFYKKNEPSSPMPILIRRAKRLVGADFMTIMRDIAPSGVDNIRSVGGGVEEEE